MRSSNNPRNSFSSSHSDNFDLDDLIEDLQSLNSPSLSNASQKSIKQNSSFYNNNNSNTGTGSLNRTEADSYKRPIGIAGKQIHDVNFCSPVKFRIIRRSKRFKSSTRIIE